MKGINFVSHFSPPLLCITESWSRAFAKIVLTLLGFFFWGAAIALLFGGAFVILTYKNYRSFFQNRFFFLPGLLAMLAAFLLFLAGGLAMCTPVRNSRHHQGILMYLLLVLSCLEVSSVVMAQIYYSRLNHQLKSSMDYVFHQYNRTVPNGYHNEAVDTAQKQLKCCGVYNYTDWRTLALPSRSHSKHVSIPGSCCRPTTLGCTGDSNQPEKLFEDGCLGKLEDRLHFVTCYLSWCFLIVGCLEVLAAVSNGLLMKEQPFQDFRILDSAVFS